MQVAATNAAVRLIRDRIELTSAFVNGLNLASLPPKSTLLLVAREIVVNQKSDVLSGVSFGDHHVVLVADRLDARDGLWVMNDTTAPLNTVGAAGPDITLFCRDLLGVSAISIGGKGGPGSPGKRGKDGPKNCEFDIEIHKVVCEFGPGENGGNGGNGAKGGNGGKITLHYVNDDVVPGGFKASGLLSLPGGGGAGGTKGKGGKGDPPGSDGKPGSAGLAGAAQPPSVTKLASEAGYWSRAMAEAGPLLATWREQRLRAAHYYFRAFRPTPDKSIYLTLARDEAQAVLHLGPTPAEAEQANRIITHLTQQLNVLGLARNASPLFIDFPRYNQDLADYESFIRDNFRDAVGGLLEVQVTQDNVRRMLERQRDHLDSQFLKDQLQNEISAAEAGRVHAATLLGDAEARRKKLQDQIKELEFRMSAESPPGGIVLANTAVLAFGVVASLAATFVASPLAGAAVASLMPLAADLLGNGATTKDLETSLNGAKDIAEVFKTKTNEAKTNAKGLQELIKDPKKSEEDWKKSAFKMVISFAKVAKELGEAVASGDPRYAQLLGYKRELFVAMHQEFLAKLNTNQAEFSKKATAAAEQLRQEDLERVKQALVELGSQDLQIRRGVLAAVQHARSIRDRLLWRVFNAARALDLYTLGYPSNSQTSEYVDLRSPNTLVRYDWGYLHPDDEAAYLDGRLLHPEFQQRVRQSMAEIESLEYEDAHTHYREKRSSRILPGAVVTYPRPDKPAEVQMAVKSFRDDKRLFFALTPADLRTGRHEAKVSGLRLTLTGVKAQTSFGCLIRHNGRSQQRWLPGENATPPVAEQLLPPAIDPIEMQPTGVTGVFSGAAVLTQPGEDQSLLLQSYGRGVAAEWTVELEPRTSGVDVTQLSDIKVEIEYESFFVPGTAGATSLQSVSHVVGALLPGATTLASLSLAAPAPQAGSIVRLRSSNPAAVKVPGAVTVPAGANAVVIPLEVTPTAAGGSATLTAAADVTLSTTVNIPAQSRAVFDMSPAGKTGFIEPVNAIASDDTFIYATHFFAKEANLHESFAAGELVRIRHSDFKEQGPRTRLGFQPRSMAINPDPAVNCLYVLNAGKESYSLSILDRTSLKEVAGSPLKLGQGGMDVAVNTRTNRVYVTNWSQHLIHVIAIVQPTTREHAVVAAIKAAAGAEALTGLFGLAIDEARNRLYAARYFKSDTPHAHAVAVINGASHTVLRTITHPQLHAPVDVTLNATGTRLYVAMLGTGVPEQRPGVAVFDLDPVTAKAVFRAVVPTRSNPWAITADHRRNQIYVTFQGGVHMIDDRALLTATPSIAATVPTGNFPQSVVVSATSEHILVGDSREGTLTRLSAPALDTTITWA